MLPFDVGTRAAPNKSVPISCSPARSRTGNTHSMGAFSAGLCKQPLLWLRDVSACVCPHLLQLPPQVSAVWLSICCCSSGALVRPDQSRGCPCIILSSTCSPSTQPPRTPAHGPQITSSGPALHPRDPALRIPWFSSACVLLPPVLMFLPVSLT